MIQVVDNSTNKYAKYKDMHMKDRLLYFIKDITIFLNFDIGKVVMFDSERNSITFRSKYVRENINLKEPILQIDYISERVPTILNIVMKEKEVVIFNNDGNLTHEDVEYTPLIKDIQQEVYIPLFGEYDSQNIIGCLYLGTFLSENSIRAQALEGDEIIYRVYRLSKHLEIIYGRSERFLNTLNMIHVFSTLLEDRQASLPNHSYNVAHWAKEIAEYLSLDEITIQQIYIAGILHDIGKIHIGKNILEKPEKLTEEEYDIIKKHSMYSYHITKEFCKNIQDLHHIPRIIKHHHERYDGTGYPEGLKGKEIPIESSILAVADAVDAMLSKREYSEAKSIQAVMKELALQKSKQFDAKITDAIIQILASSKQKQTEIFSVPIVQATMAITLKDKIYFNQGQLIKMDPGFIFKMDPENSLDELDKINIKQMDLYINDRQNIFEYSVRIKELKNETIYISNLKLKPKSTAFKLSWNLYGLIHIDMSKHQKVYDINIHMIGGNVLSFYISEYEINDLINSEISYLKIFFDEENIDITGKIIKSYKIGINQYFEFDYSNLHDSKKDKIYKYLFRKQIEFRKSINPYV
ncbi:HD domain-containing protein [Lutibacter sp. B2]|nr:HD domain-containing protein [Lutibacter sp. B2]